MLVAHHVVDVLRGVVSRPFLTEFKDVSDCVPPRKIADLIERAQKFDFGELHLELKETLPSGPVYALPALSDEEIGFWADGLIVLPFEVCWFEFTLNGYRSGLLIHEIGDEWGIHRIDWMPDEMVYDGLEVVINRAETRGGEFNIRLRGNTALYHRLHDHPSGAATANSMASSAPLVVYMALMINSKSTEVVPAPSPSPRLNRRRVARGRSPLPDHRIVTIVPRRWSDPETCPRGGGAGRRLHWRRSHLRHYESHTPASRWSPEAVHNGRKGWWVAVIPRHLVGRAELGEVSHEYRVGGVNTIQSRENPILFPNRHRPGLGGVSSNGDAK